MHSPTRVDFAADLLCHAGQAVRLPVQGTSMIPWIEDGDALVIEPVGASSRVRPGDILFCRTREGAFLCHRLIRYVTRGRERCLLTKGDWLLRPDNPIPVGECLGRVRAVVREGRSIPWLDRDRGLARALSRALALGSGLARAFVPILSDFIQWKAGGR